MAWMGKVQSTAFAGVFDTERAALAHRRFVNFQGIAIAAEVRMHVSL